MSQTAYTLDSAQAIEGQLFDANLQAQDIVSYVAASDISAGRMVELLGSGMIQETQSASLANLAGIAVFNSFVKATSQASVGKSYKAGEIVPVLRQGRIFVATTGAAPTAGAALNVNSNASASTDRGKATVTIVGANIFATPVKCFKASSVSGLTCAEINIP